MYISFKFENLKNKNKLVYKIIVKFTTKKF